MARHEAEVLQRALGQSFVVENKPGAGGEIGISYAAKAAPDGYTLLHAPSIIILLPYVKRSVSYDLAKDFVPVMLTGLTQFALVVSPALPVSSVKDLIALAKSKPGQQLAGFFRPRRHATTDHRQAQRRVGCGF